MYRHLLAYHYKCQHSLVYVTVLLLGKMEVTVHDCNLTRRMILKKGILTIHQSHPALSTEDPMIYTKKLPGTYRFILYSTEGSFSHVPPPFCVWQSNLLLK